MVCVCVEMVIETETITLNPVNRYFIIICFNDKLINTFSKIQFEFIDCYVSAEFFFIDKTINTYVVTYELISLSVDCARNLDTNLIGSLLTYYVNYTIIVYAIKHDNYNVFA